MGVSEHVNCFCWDVLWVTPLLVCLATFMSSFIDLSCILFEESYDSDWQCFLPEKIYISWSLLQVPSDMEQSHLSAQVDTVIPCSAQKPCHWPEDQHSTAELLLESVPKTTPFLHISHYCVSTQTQAHRWLSGEVRKEGRIWICRVHGGLPYTWMSLDQKLFYFGPNFLI